MIKSIRTFAFVAVLSIAAAAPSLLAEPMGCNPRPPSKPSTNVIAVAQVVGYTVLAYFGL